MSVFGKCLYLCRSAMAEPMIPTMYDFMSDSSVH